MTASRTEERLRNALGATADVIPDTAYPPGVPAPPERARLIGRRSVLVLAGATTVALGAGVPAYLATRKPGIADDAWATGMTTLPPAVRPPYFLAREWATPDSSLTRIRDSRTGKATDTLPGSYSEFASSPDQRTFYLVRHHNIDVNHNGGWEEEDVRQSELVRIRVDAAGKVVEDTTLTEDGNDQKDGPSFGQLAVSPNGRFLAYLSDGLVVYDPETGARRRWRFPDETEAVSMSWTPDGRSLVLLLDGRDLRVLDLVKDRNVSDARRVPMPRTPKLPGFGNGLLLDAQVEAAGRSVLAVFSTDEWLPQGEAKASVRIDLDTGKTSVVDGKLKEKGIGVFAFDASRRHLLVITGDHADNVKGQWGVRHYDAGKSTPLPRTDKVEAIAW